MIYNTGTTPSKQYIATCISCGFHQKSETVQIHGLSNQYWCEAIPLSRSIGGAPNRFGEIIDETQVISERYSSIYGYQVRAPINLVATSIGAVYELISRALPDAVMHISIRILKLILM